MQLEDNLVLFLLHFRVFRSETRSPCLFRFIPDDVAFKPWRIQQLLERKGVSNVLAMKPQYGDDGGALVWSLRGCGTGGACSVRVVQGHCQIYILRASKEAPRLLKNSWRHFWVAWTRRAK